MPDYLARLKSWQDEGGILRFCDEQFGVTLDAWQERSLLAFADPRPDKRQISLQACTGPGKSAVLSWCGLWFLGTQGEVGEHPRGLATSITGENLKDNLWAEFSKWMQRSPYLSQAFTWTSSRIFAKDHPTTWFLGSRSWPKTASPEEQGTTFSGLHAKYVCCIIDESGAIPTPVMRAASQALGRCKFGKLIQAGNPVSLEGMLYAAASQLRHQWTVITITGDPDDPEAWVHSPRVGDGPKAWATEQIHTYGRDNPWVMSYVLGKFPPASINALLSVDEVETAMRRHLREDAYAWAQKRLGIDVARYGDDRTVIYPRQGIASFKPLVLRHARGSTVSTDIATRVLRAKAVWKSEMELMDATGGWGAGARDVLVTAGVPVIEIQFGSPADEVNRYANRRSEIWFRMAEWIQQHGALAPVTELIGELTAPTYSLSPKGQLIVEPKKLVKARLGRSPDLADALAVTFGIAEMPAAASAPRLIGQMPGKALHDFDPHA